MQIENKIVMQKSAATPLLPKESGANGEAVKISGAKRPVEEYPSNSPQHLCSTSNPGSGHLVYVRRKAEAESGRSSGCDNQSDRRSDGQQLRKSSEPNETSQRQAELKEPRNPMTEVLSTSGASSAVFSSTKPSLSSSLPRSSINLIPSSTTHHFTSTTNSLLADPKRVDINYFHDHYCNLQKLLEELEQSSQDDYIQMLRSLSSVELSRHAIELEKRSIQLSLEEAKELQRVRVLNVLGRYSTNL